MTFLVAPLEAVVRPRDVLMWTSTSKQLRVNSRPTVDRLLQRLSHASLLKEHLATIHMPFRERHRASSVAPRPTQLQHFSSALSLPTNFGRAWDMRNRDARGRLAVFLQNLYPPHFELEQWPPPHPLHKRHSNALHVMRSCRHQWHKQIRHRITQADFEIAHTLLDILTVGERSLSAFRRELHTSDARRSAPRSHVTLGPGEMTY